MHDSTLIAVFSRGSSWGDGRLECLPILLINNKPLKDKILKYLCKKANVTLLVDDERYLEAQHANGFCVYVKSCRPEGVHSIYFKMIEINDQDEILDVLLNEVREDYSICFYDQWNNKP